WAMMGNGSAMARIFDRVVEMATFGSVTEHPRCPYEAGSLLSGVATPSHCPHPLLSLRTSGGSEVVAGDPTTFLDNLRIFDLGLTLGANLDLDLANAYYIYIMAALYFAVPA